MWKKMKLTVYRSELGPEFMVMGTCETDLLVPFACKLLEVDGVYAL